MLNDCWDMYVHIYTYIYIHIFTQFNVAALDFWSSQNLSFPHNFAQVQNGQHCLHLSTNRYWQWKTCPNLFGGSIRWGWNESLSTWTERWKIQTSCILVSKLLIGFFDFAWLALKVRVVFCWLYYTEINSLNIPQWCKLLTWWFFKLPKSREDSKKYNNLFSVIFLGIPWS